MNTSAQKRSSSSMLGNKFVSFAKSRLPVANKPKTRAHRRSFRDVAPVPFAPLVDTYAFQPPPPYSARPDDPAEILVVPHNTPETSGLTATEPSFVLTGCNARPPIGLGIEGVENGDGGRFDGLGRLSGGFRAGGASDAFREQVQRVLDEHARRRRTRASEQPIMRHDVFYASVRVQASSVPTSTVKVRIRRKSAGSPTSVPKGVTRGTISSELKRAASLERRASMKGHRDMTPWRV